MLQTSSNWQQSQLNSNNYIKQSKVDVTSTLSNFTCFVTNLKKTRHLSYATNDSVICFNIITKCCPIIVESQAIDNKLDTYTKKIGALVMKKN